MCNPEIVSPEPAARTGEQRTCKSLRRWRFMIPTNAPFRDLAVLIQAVDPVLDLSDDLGQLQHSLGCRDLNEFLRLGRRVSHA